MPQPLSQGLLNLVSGSNVSQFGGLLSPEEQGAARTQAMMNAGLAILTRGAGQPGAGKPSFGEVLSQGLLAGQQGYQQSAQNLIHGRLLQQESARLAEAQQRTNAMKEIFSDQNLTRPEMLSQASQLAMTGGTLPDIKVGLELEAYGAASRATHLAAKEKARALEKKAIVDSMAPFWGMSNAEIEADNPGITKGAPELFASRLGEAGFGDAAKKAYEALDKQIQETELHNIKLDDAKAAKEQELRNVLEEARKAAKAKQETLTFEQAQKELDAQEIAKQDRKQDMLNIVNVLLTENDKGGNKDGLLSSVGPWDFGWMDITPSAREARRDLKRIQDMFTVKNLGIMQGPLTDSDIILIANISSGVHSGLTEKRVVHELERIRSAILEMYHADGKTKFTPELGYINPEPNKKGSSTVVSGGG